MSPIFKDSVYFSKEFGSQCEVPSVTSARFSRGAAEARPAAVRTVRGLEKNIVAMKLRKRRELRLCDMLLLKMR